MIKEKTSFFLPALEWFIIAFFVRLLFLIFIHFYSLQTGFGGFYPLESGSDDRYYFEVAQEILYGHIPQTLPNYYPYFLAFVFFFTGPSLFLGQLINVLAGSFTVYFGVLIAKEISSSKLKGKDLRHPVNIAGFFLSFYPASVFYSTQLLKDPLVTMVGIVSLYVLILIFKKFRFLNLIILVFLLLFLSFLRGYTMLALLITTFIYLILFRRINIKYVFAGVLLFALIPWIAGHGIFGIKFLSSVLNPENLVSTRETVYSIGGSAAGIKIDFSSIHGFFLTYVYSFITAMLGPLPWQIKSFTVAIGLLDAVWVWLLIPQWIKGIKKLLKRREVEIGELVLLFSLVLIGIIALFSDNIGANTRLRMLAWDVFFIYAASLFGLKK
ncbi:hypothetical protein [Thermoanaerobacter indiensis]|uniref:hypothetical protein n=1 Tax=Thermoanaerobacter indiensis TaxID=1125974 RepID=UPI000372A5A2|nr:hypothetical protein [Thermoanaerobacter indiensis]